VRPLVVWGVWLGLSLWFGIIGDPLKCETKAMNLFVASSNSTGELLANGSVFFPRLFKAAPPEVRNERPKLDKRFKMPVRAIYQETPDFDTPARRTKTTDLFSQCLSKRRFRSLPLIALVSSNRQVVPEEITDETCENGKLGVCDDVVDHLLWAAISLVVGVILGLNRPARPNDGNQP
jgi:hypothetical protein